MRLPVHLAIGMDEFLNPTTDGGVLAQLVVVITLALPAMWLARRNRDILIFVIGVAFFVAALMAFRVLH